jgi:hypothetical protein
VLYSILYHLLRLLIEILIVRGRGDAQLRAEILALRHQLGVLERQVGRPRRDAGAAPSAWVLERQVGRPRWQATDRLLLAAISRALPKAGLAFIAAQPGDAAALASGGGPPQGWSSVAPTSRLTWCRSRPGGWSAVIGSEACSRSTSEPPERGD